MKTHVNTGVEERDQWRARITRALSELRGDDKRTPDGHMRRDPTSDEILSEDPAL